ncbi:helix-turn-helix domain-containing protein [Amycolatopsis australiensis]|uniref:PucR C-terminal helix-turn-helix domain-containing protein n=1 Tax=Amycolatopsis australiensis TaxID=546364 RepID=A0A1K1SH85_9PSEU|nr:helix-turn-helix domain-containing protein [Amycolatopsis australiensis]SFW83670.1 PucR C-terminal helix-turn-helix domain-containing protein [Amycolatopsis australiensis]
MKGLLLRLSGLDADAENAVRVIGFFDRLITGHAGPDGLVRSTAELAGCPVGVHAPGQGLSLRAEPGEDVTTPGAPPPGAATRTLEGGIQVWVARAGAPIPLDDMLLERFAIATAILLGQGGVPRPELGDPALVELVLSADAGTAERSRALHLLGIPPTSRLRVLAGIGLEGAAGRSAELGGVRAVLADGTSARGWMRDGGSVQPGDAVAGALADGRPAGRSAQPGGAVAHPLTNGRSPQPDRAMPTQLANGPAVRSPLPGSAVFGALPEGARVGVGPEVAAIDAARSWAGARTALRFTSAAEPVVFSDRLGSLAALAGKLTTADFAELADVHALDRLAAEPHGADTLAALDALCATGSARKAAAVLHRHHSTMPARLARAEAVLGFEVDSPGGRFRLHLALMLRRLRDNTVLNGHESR